MEHLKEFMLELGRGFSFKGRHIRITINNEHYYPDLVFYNTKLKCYVIIDLKVKKTKHKDIGQMSMYVNYYDREIKEDDDNNTVGILLSIDKNKTLVDYTLNNNSNIISREYKLNIPSKEELIAIVEEEKNLLW